MAIDACGGGGSSKNTVPPPVKVVADQTSISLNHGQVLQLTNVHSIDSSGNTAINTATPTYSSDNPNVTVDTNGNVCAGIFDSTHVACSTKDASGNPLPATKANITITQGSVKSDPIPVFVHDAIETLQLSTTSVPCTSQGGTQQYTATALNGGKDISSTVGPATFSLTDSTIATIDTNGLVTSKLPGATNVVASVGGVRASPLPFISCPPASIGLHELGKSNINFSLAPAGTVQYTVDAADVLGKPIVNLPVSVISNAPTVATLSTSFLVTAVAPGEVSLLVSCTPPSCNPNSAITTNGLPAGLPVYSNLVTGTVSGSTASTLYVTGSKNADGSDNKTLIPIDTTTNAAGTAITLPQVPNSLVFNRLGTVAYLGSSAGLMAFNPATNTIAATVTGVNGKVLAVSPDGGKVIVSDTSTSTVYLFNAALAQVQQTISLGGVFAADFSPDGLKAYLINGGNVTAFVPGAPLRTLAIVASSVAYLPQGSAAYFGTGSNVRALATCNDQQVDAQAAGVNILAAARLGDHLIGASGSSWVDLTLNIGLGCPPAASSGLRETALLGGAGTPTQVTITPDSRFAFITGYSLASGQTASGALPGYNTAPGTAFSVPLVNGAGQVLSGDTTNDSKQLYVGVGPSAAGATDQAVHLIDISGNSPTDVKQIPTTFIPSLVAVRPK